MEKTKSDYERGLDRGLELALEVINSTAGVKFDSVAEVGLYLYCPERYAHFKKLTEEKEPA